MRRFTVMGLVVAVLAAACSGGPSKDVLAFCDAFVEVEAAFSGEPDPATIGGLIDRVDELAPSAIATDIGTMTTTARTVLSTGDFAAFESDEFGAASEAVDDYLVAECGYETFTVSAIDYAYEGVPERVKSGTVAIEFQNDGTEFHEILLMRRNEGVTEGFAELLGLPEEEAMTKVTMVGAEFAEPGGSGTTFVRLDPGAYAILCFIPVGATPENLPALESGEFEGGPPHFTLGMLAELTVED